MCFLENVAIDIECKGHARVPQLLRNQPRRDSLAKGEHGKGVAQIVKPDIRQTGARDERFESALDEVPFMDRAARRTFEQQPVATEFARADMARDQRGDFGGKGDRPPAARALGPGEPPLSPRAFERARDRQRRPAAVEVAGLQRQIFARAHARGQCHEKNEFGRILAADCGKTPRFLRCKDLEFAFVGAGQRHPVGWIPGQQLPAPGRPKTLRRTAWV